VLRAATRRHQHRKLPVRLNRAIEKARIAQNSRAAPSAARTRLSELRPRSRIGVTAALRAACARARAAPDGPRGSLQPSLLRPVPLPLGPSAAWTAASPPSLKPHQHSRVCGGRTATGRVWRSPQRPRVARYQPLRALLTHR